MEWTALFKVKQGYVYIETIIIAEAGVNHNGSIKIARDLIDVAFDAGADFVKFQTFKAEFYQLSMKKLIIKI